MDNLFSLQGKTALITGASSGLGQEFARTLAGHGATVVLAARRVDALEALAAEIAQNGGKAQVVPLDVGHEDQVIAAFDAAAAGLGVPDIVVNNAGISREAWASQMDAEDFDAVMNINLRGVFLVAREASRRMIASQKAGSIINIASILGRRVTHTLSAYAASKAAVEHLTRSLALELAHYRIRVNAIAPGYFPTEINDGFFDTDAGKAMMRRVPMRRTGQLGELAGPLMLLASDAGSYMTGSTLVVDGGHLNSSL